jgi:hypothetical protein
MIWGGRDRQSMLEGEGIEMGEKPMLGRGEADTEDKKEEEEHHDCITIAPQKSCHHPNRRLMPRAAGGSPNPKNSCSFRNNLGCVRFWN